jgi:peptide/nickel transport system substrate-binding protein
MKSSWKWRRLLALLAVFALIVAACGDDDDDDGASDDSADVSDDGASDDGGDDGGTGEVGFTCPADQRGGEIKIASGAPVSGIDPTLLFGTGAVGGDYGAAVYDIVWRYDVVTGEYGPNIGETLEATNDDKTAWTLTIRDGVTFGSGDPYTTTDIKAHIEALPSKFRRAAGMAALVTEMEIVDDLTMNFTLSAPFNMEYLLSTEPGWVPNSRLFAEKGEGFATDPAGAGAGPYEVDSITPGEEIVLKAKESYWGGRACIDTLRFQFVANPATKIDALETGEFDVVFVNSVTQADDASEITGNTYYPATGALTYILADQGITGGGETPFNDVRVREAMQLAINYDTLNERIYENLFPITNSAIMPFESDISPQIDGPGFDTDRAAELLQETVDDGVWAEKGDVPSFTFLATAADNDRAVLLEAMWEAVGFDVTIETVDNMGARVIAERNFEVATNGFAVLPEAPWTTLNGLGTWTQPWLSSEGRSPKTTSVRASLRCRRSGTRPSRWS